MSHFGSPPSPGIVEEKKMPQWNKGDMQLHDSQVQPWGICDDMGKQILFSRGAMISVLILDERNTLLGANKDLF